MSLYISTSRGVYKYNIRNDNITQVISNWKKGLFKKPSKGFFGICLNKSQNEIIFASRERLSKEIDYEKSTDTIIYFYNFMIIQQHIFSMISTHLLFINSCNSK